ncbi:hypothetical protein [Polaromonas jejuensis]|uniref:Uncharacterized protein n=1 Tax=Polaromonas jejuensis TaxID=457502 RepID=A0ABW0Q4P7_9BURK|nr:hypothetical protein [Polaromonas jejuensis]
MIQADLYMSLELGDKKESVSWQPFTGARRLPPRPAQSAWRQTKNEQLATSPKSLNAPAAGDYQSGNSNH